MKNMVVTENERNIALSIVEKIIGLDCWEDFDHAGLFHEGFDYYDGETKSAIFHRDLEDWIIKYTKSRCSHDYCQREYENYVAAEAAGLGHYFAQTEYLCERDGVTYFLQEKLEIYEDADSEMVESLRSKYESSGREYDIDDLWYEVEDADAYERTLLLYDNEKLSQFIFDHRINDLHNGSFGRRHGSYVILDFSGFGNKIWEEQ